jgi:hypothetical protein
MSDFPWQRVHGYWPLLEIIGLSDNLRPLARLAITAGIGLNKSPLAYSC